MAGDRRRASVDVKRTCTRPSSHQTRQSFYHAQSGHPSPPTPVQNPATLRRPNLGPRKECDGAEKELRPRPWGPRGADKGWLDGTPNGEVVPTPTTQALAGISRKRPREVDEVAPLRRERSTPGKNASSAAWPRRRVGTPTAARSASRHCPTPGTPQGARPSFSVPTTRPSESRVVGPAASGRCGPLAPSWYATPREAASPAHDAAPPRTRVSLRQSASGVPRALPPRSGSKLERLVPAEPLTARLLANSNAPASCLAVQGFGTLASPPGQPEMRGRFSGPIEPVPRPSGARPRQMDRPGRRAAEEQRRRLYPHAAELALYTKKQLPPARNPKDDLDDSNTLAYWRHFANMQRMAGERVDTEKLEKDARDKARRMRKVQEARRIQRREQKSGSKE